MTSPGVIGANRVGSGPGGLEGATEIRKRKCGYTVAHALSNHFVIKGAHGLTELREQVALVSSGVRSRWGRRSFVCVRIKATQRAKENLALHAQRVSQTDQTRDLKQLIAERSGWESGNNVRIRTTQRCARRQSLIGRIVGCFEQHFVRIKAEQLGEIISASGLISRRSATHLKDQYAAQRG